MIEESVTAVVTGERRIVTDVSNAQMTGNCHENERDVHPHETVA